MSQEKKILSAFGTAVGMLRLRREDLWSSQLRSARQIPRAERSSHDKIARVMQSEAVMIAKRYYCLVEASLPALRLRPGTIPGYSFRDTPESPIPQSRPAPAPSPVGATHSSPGRKSGVRPNKCETSPGGTA
jgi:hypothetical protein